MGDVISKNLPRESQQEQPPSAGREAVTDELPVLVMLMKKASADGQGDVGWYPLTGQDSGEFKT